MKLIILTIIISVITQCQAYCRALSETQVECSSSGEVKSTYQDNWTEINIKSKSAYGTEIEEKFLQNTPNVKKVTFENNISNIQNNAFQGASQLRAIHFYSSNLFQIKPTWFSNLPIVDLIIFDSKVNSLQPRCFQNTPYLKRVNIRKNSIYRIPSDVFRHTTIEILFLNNNKIEIIEEDAFYEMEHLKMLALENNLLTAFEPEKYIGNTSPNMYMLWLSNNYIRRITRNNFEYFPKLRILLLHFNELDKIEVGAFNGANQLSYLDVSNNKLTEFSPRALPAEGLEYMDIFLIQNNRLSYLSTEIIAKFPRLSKMTIGGNPWQCPCYNEISKFIYNKGIRIICDKEYLDGKRPICVVPIHYKQCLHNSSITDELYLEYNNARREYENLPPLCKIMCADKRPCYANEFSNLLYDEIS